MIAFTIWQGARWKALAFTSVLLAIGLVTLLDRGMGWVGSWRQAIDWGTGSVILLGPLAAGLAAWQYARMRQSDFAEFASTAPRGLVAWLAPGGLVWIQGSLAVLTCTLVAGLTTVALGVPPHWTDLVILPEAFVVLGADVAIGAALGVVSGRTWAAPPAVVITYVLVVASGWGLLPGIFDTGGVTGSLVGEEFNGPVIFLQGTAALGIAAGATWAMVSALAVRSRWTIAALVLPVISGAVAYVQLGDTGHERYRYTDDPIRYTCAGDSPEVCLAEDTPRPLKALEREFTRQASILEPLGFTFPDRFMQSIPGMRYSADVGIIAFYDNGESRTDADPYAVSVSLGTPAGCPEYASADLADGDALKVRFVLMDWIADRTGTDDVTDGSIEGRWMASDQGLAWALATYPKVAACDFRNPVLPPFPVH